MTKSMQGIRTLVCCTIDSLSSLPFPLTSEAVIGPVLGSAMDGSIKTIIDEIK